MICHDCQQIDINRRGLWFCQDCGKQHCHHVETCDKCGLNRNHTLYTVEYGLDVSAYGLLKLPGNNLDDVIERARKLYRENEARFFQGGWDYHPDVGTENHRIVHVLNPEGEIVAEAIDLDPEPSEPDNSVCPKCGGADLEGGHIEVLGSETWQEVTCPTCHATWTEYYKFVRREDLVTPEQQ